MNNILLLITVRIIERAVGAVEDRFQFSIGCVLGADVLHFNNGSLHSFTVWLHFAIEKYKAMEGNSDSQQWFQWIYFWIK